jgi:hypothetical protein
MWFTVDELEAMDLPWTAEWIESRGRGKTGEYVDLCFRRDWTLYHVLMFIAPDGTQTYPESFPLEDGVFVVDCPEVELYATRRHVVQFRKVTDAAPL